MHGMADECAPIGRVDANANEIARQGRTFEAHAGETRRAAFARLFDEDMLLASDETLQPSRQRRVALRAQQGCAFFHERARELRHARRWRDLEGSEGKDM